MTRLLVALVTLLTLACSHADSPFSDDYITPDTPLTITVETPETSRGVIVDTPTEMGTLGLYCEMTGYAEWSSQTEFEKMNNQQYSITTSGSWISDGDNQQWGYYTLNDKYTFFAYSPYNEESQGITPRIDAGELLVAYDVAESSRDQPDLMIAEPRKNIYPQLSGSLPLTFYHALSCVSFSVISLSDIKITAIDISGVVGSGTLGWDYTSSSPKWSLDELSDDTYSVEVKDYKLDNDDTARLNTKRGYLMMIPQLLDKGAEVTVTMSSGEKKRLSIPANSEWVAGDMYNYVIRLGEHECDFYFSSEQISNCYIINPTAGQETVVQIPIEDRINEFWLNYSETGNKKIKQKDTVEEFWVVTVWQDFGDNFSYTYTILDDYDEKMAVRLYIPSDFQEGNLLFAIRKDDGNNSYDTLWSWHLWFTAYNPDAIADANRANIKSGAGAYDLKEENYIGEVHRYADKSGDTSKSAVWSGIYRDKFIMDRNIGERTVPSTTYGAGSVYYEFGRKDPFPGNAAQYGWGDKNNISVRSSSGFSFDQSIEFVRDFITAGTSAIQNWTSNIPARTDNLIWYDKNLDADNYTVGKSIFDPSPLGWRVPVSDTWNGFPTTVANYIYYSYRDPDDDADLSQSTSMGYVWSANRYDYESAYCFHYSDPQANSPSIFYVTYGFPVRAIEE